MEAEIRLMNREPKYRWPLKKDQLEVLELLYRFRFASSDLVARYFGKKTGAFAYKRLMILQDQGYIGKRFDSSYRIKGKPAAYYLTPDGARVLQGKLGIEVNIKTLYKETSVSEEFISHSLGVLEVYLYLRQAFGDRLKLFTKSELSKYDYFPAPLPDAYIRLQTAAGEKQFFLDLFHAHQPFYYKKRARLYMNYIEDATWDVTPDHPAILFVCDTPALRTRVFKQFSKLIGEPDGATIALTDKSFFISGTGGLWEVLGMPGEFVRTENIT